MSITKDTRDINAYFEIEDLLGTGAFSEVKRATERATGMKYAIKIIDKSKCAGKEGMIQSEIAILKKVKHENIISLMDMFETKEKLYLVMELVTGGELFDSIVSRGHYTELETARIVERILLAVNYLHEMGIAHRDLKPENLLFSEPGPKAKIMISDFGLSKIFNDEEVMKTACGTPGYVAPEVLKRLGYGKEVDLWSTGVITYILLCGYPPFFDENNLELFGQIMRGEYEFDSPYWDKVSDKAKDFISKLLVVDPSRRLTTRGALAHPFVADNCGTHNAERQYAQIGALKAAARQKMEAARTAATSRPATATSAMGQIPVARANVVMPPAAQPVPMPAQMMTAPVAQDHPASMMQQQKPQTPPVANSTVRPSSAGSDKMAGDKPKSAGGRQGFKVMIKKYVTTGKTQ